MYIDWMGGGRERSIARKKGPTIDDEMICLSIDWLKKDNQSPYSSIISRRPSMVLAARGSKITLNGKGWVFADSVKAKSSIGADRSGLTLKAHRISAVLRKTELFERGKNKFVVC